MPGKMSFPTVPLEELAVRGILARQRRAKPAIPIVNNEAFSPNMRTVVMLQDVPRSKRKRW